MTARLAAAVTVVLALASARPAAARGAPDPKRPVAVLEFRGGSSAVPDIGARAARLLRENTSLTVIDPSDARTRLGAGVDKTIAECAGDAGCIATIGKKLEVAEVLLVGVSEFGDVIVTLQRIDVRTGDVSSRVAEALAPHAAPDDEALTGYLRRVMPRSDFVRYGTIKVVSDVSGAEVFVGDEPRGHTPLDPLRVRAPAKYPIRVAKPGYTQFKATVDVPPDGVITVEPVLSRSRKAWYDNWWVPTLAGAVLVGAVVVTVAATSEDPTSHGSVIRW